MLEGKLVFRSGDIWRRHLEGGSAMEIKLACLGGVMEERSGYTRGNMMVEVVMEHWSGGKYVPGMQLAYEWRHQEDMMCKGLWSPGVTEGGISFVAYCLVVWAVGWLLGPSRRRSVGHNFLKGMEVTLPCSYRGTCSSKTLK